MYEEMMEQKLTACRKAYEEEFEIIAKQFEEFKDYVDDQRLKWSAVQALVADQEEQNVNMNNMIEAVGQEMMRAQSERRMSEPIEGIEQDDLMNFVSEMNDNPDSVHSEVVETVKSADLLLTKAFNFYGSSIRINVDDQIDIANRAYIRFYKMKLNQVLWIKMQFKRSLKLIRECSKLSNFKLKSLSVKLRRSKSRKRL